MSIIDQETLRRLYIDEKQSIRSIAAILQVAPGTVYDAMMRYRIPRRQSGRRRFIPSANRTEQPQFDEAMLRYLYVDKNHSIREVAALVDATPSMVYTALVRLKIPRHKRGPHRKLTSLTL